MSDERAPLTGVDLQLDAVLSTAAIAYGWLWHLTTNDPRVISARHLLRGLLSRDLLAYGIRTAKAEGARVDIEEIEALLLRGFDPKARGR